MLRESRSSRSTSTGSVRSVVPGCLVVGLLLSATTGIRGFQNLDVPQKNSLLSTRPVHVDNLLALGALTHHDHDVATQKTSRPHHQKADTRVAKKNIANQCLAFFCALGVTMAPLHMDSYSSIASASVPPEQPKQESLLAAGFDKKQENSVVEEVWGLVNKYYIDRTFNGQVSLNASKFKD